MKVHIYVKTNSILNSIIAYNSQNIILKLGHSKSLHLNVLKIFLPALKFFLMIRINTLYSDLKIYSICENYIF